MLNYNELDKNIKVLNKIKDIDINQINMLNKKVSTINRIETLITNHVKTQNNTQQNEVCAILSDTFGG